MNISAIFIFVCQSWSFFIQLLAVTLDVLHHQIFASQLHMIGKMVDHPGKQYINTKSMHRLVNCRRPMFGWLFCLQIVSRYCKMGGIVLLWWLSSTSNKALYFFLFLLFKQTKKFAPCIINLSSKARKKQLIWGWFYLLTFYQNVGDILYLHAELGGWQLAIHTVTQYQSNGLAYSYFMKSHLDNLLPKIYRCWQ